jgi:thiosulfate/3-mercaptopyruvate sulfurtransferase
MINQVRQAMLALAVCLSSTAAMALDMPGPLVTPAWLQQHRGEVNVLDVREDPGTFIKAPAFADEKGKKALTGFGGHIPDARLLDFAKIRTTRVIDGHDVKWMLPDKDAFQALMRDVGVRGGRPTVIVSDGAGGGDLDMAARVYWSMKVYGETRLAILDGGTTAWLSAGLPFSIDAGKAGAGDWTAGKEHKEYVADSSAVARAIGSGKQLVDARPMPFYVGLERKPVVTASGHIEGAVDFPPDVRAAKVDGSTHFLGSSQYAAIFKHLDLDLGKPSITYCNTGHLASGAWFVLSEIMKNPDTRLYDGSMYLWTSENRSVVGLP